MPIPLAPLAIGGALLSAGGQIAGGIAQGQAASYQSQVAANNAIIAKQNATSAGTAASQDIETAGLKDRATESNTRASIAANNLDVNSGSPADVQISQRETGALNTSNVARNAGFNVYGYETQATGFQAQSELDSAEASEAPIAGAISGAGSLLSAAPNIGFANSWMSQNGGATVGDLFGPATGLGGGQTGGGTGGIAPNG
jgi:hypothetical protein